MSSSSINIAFLVATIFFGATTLVQAQQGSLVGTGVVNSGVIGGGADSCGVTSIETMEKYFAAMESSRNVTRGATETFQWKSEGDTGAGPLTVEVDDTCKGVTFSKPLTVVKNIPSTGAFTESFQISIPADFKCSCSVADLCLVRFKAAKQSVACGFITLNDAPVAAVTSSFNGGYQGFAGQYDPRYMYGGRTSSRYWRSRNTNRGRYSRYY